SRHGISCSRHLSRSQAEIPLIPAVQISRASSTQEGSELDVGERAKLFRHQVDHVFQEELVCVGCLRVDGEQFPDIACVVNVSVHVGPQKVNLRDIRERLRSAQPPITHNQKNTIATVML
ncbi:hypothetical protein, partial [Agrobacterium tumefaciens]|uniref:hypothetical protein n=1 Tax=Agrobacterium tumefaciens TaxID=358 RepID=UPI001AE89959